MSWLSYAAMYPRTTSATSSLVIDMLLAPTSFNHYPTIISEMEFNTLLNASLLFVQEIMVESQYSAQHSRLSLEKSESVQIIRENGIHAAQEFFFRVINADVASSQCVCFS